MKCLSVCSNMFEGTIKGLCLLGENSNNNLVNIFIDNENNIFMFDGA